MRPSILPKPSEFVFRKGRPSSVVSDNPINKLDWKEITSKNSATGWPFVPVGGQQRNGISEATVKVMKKSLALALAPGIVLTYAGPRLITLSTVGPSPLLTPLLVASKKM